VDWCLPICGCGELYDMGIGRSGVRGSAWSSKIKQDSGDKAESNQHGEKYDERPL
jgi:hypothetical protein